MRYIRITIMLMFSLVVFIMPAPAEVESEIITTIKLSGPAKDMEISKDGEQIYVLDAQGKLLIYSRFGELVHGLFVGKHFSQIKVGPEGDELFLYDKEKQTIQIVDLLFIYDIDISNSPYKGPADAAVTVVVFSDFQCPYCARAADFMDEVQKQYPNVKYVFKHYPLNSHKYAFQAAQAAAAAQELGKFWEFHDLLFKNYNRLDASIVEDIRNTLDLDKTQFEKKIKAPGTIKKIQSDKKDGIEVGVRGTPAFYVNGKKVEKNSFEDIKTAVEAALTNLTHNKP